VTAKYADFWDIKTQFVPHRRQIKSPLQSPACKCYVRFEVFTVVAQKNAVFWDIKTFTGDALHLGYRAQPINTM
jgi:hypothetical protein